MLSVSLDQLAEQSETIAAEVRAGHTLNLLDGGKRIADIVPAPAPYDLSPPQFATEAEREAARADLRAFLDKGVDLGGRPFTYEERTSRR
jgi:antitoxin (DNA-binding transcriptional repressor) of toxin-antitoxin stability system